MPRNPSCPIRRPVHLFPLVVATSALAVLLPTVPSAHAKLGENLEQLTARFGRDYWREDGVVLHFRSSGRVAVDAVLGPKGTCIEETYFSKKPLDAKGEPPADVVQAILKANAPAGTKWRETSYEAADYALQSADGSVLAALRYRKPQAEGATWTMSVSLPRETAAVAARVAAERRGVEASPASRPTPTPAAGKVRVGGREYTEAELLAALNNKGQQKQREEQTPPSLSTTTASRMLPKPEAPAPAPEAESPPLPITAGQDKPQNAPIPTPTPTSVRVAERDFTSAEMLQALRKLGPPPSAATPSP